LQGSLGGRIGLFFLGLNVQPGYSQESESQKILSLMDEGRELSKQGRHVEAIRLVEKALTMGEKEFGREHYLILNDIV